VLLGEELALAQARRLYDYTLLELARKTSDGSDLCTFQEWWAVLQSNPLHLDALVPGVHRILWVLRPVGNSQKKQPVSKEKRGGSILRKPGQMTRKNTLDLAQRKFKASVSSNNTFSEARHDANSRGTANTERFRVQAAVRFRHAVRGEWDAVDILQNQQGQELLKLPSVQRAGSKNRPAGMLGDNSAHSSDPWADALHSFGRRQRQSNWHDGHRDTLADWSKAGFCPSASMGQSQSLPDLRGRRRRHVLESSSPPPTPGALCHVSNSQLTEAQARGNMRVAAEAKSAVDRMPSTTQRFGEKAVHRIRKCSEVRASGGSAAVTTNEASADRVGYDCQLCGGRHDVCVPCLV